MKAVLVASGEPTDSDRRSLDDADLVIAVDAGASWLAEAGIRPHALIGDMDSVDALLLASFEADGVAIERHPAAKDSSDTELALEYALRVGATEVVILGAFGGRRLDHELANLALLADPGLRGRDVRLVRGGSTVRVLRGGDQVVLEGTAGDVVTLLPIGGDAVGVQTIGLRYPLSGETLGLGRSRGLSNVVVASPASVSLERGMLLVIETKEEGVEP